jgi:predicted MarR family transcription regulator
VTTPTRRPGKATRRRAKPAAAASEFAPSPASRELSDFEFTLIILTHGFSRWVVNCMEAANLRGLGALDILVLHTVNHRARDRRLSEVCMVLNIDDTHLVAYALKKLVAAGLVAITRRGRERHYQTTAAGDAACLGYRQVREQFLVQSLAWLSDGRAVLPNMTAFLRTMTALYDQAGRFATAASLERPATPPVRTK